MNSSLRNLSIKNLKMNKAKSKLVLIAIILSTCLITAISILSYSLQQAELRSIKARTGDVHVVYRDLSEEQVQILKNNKKLLNVRESTWLGANTEYLPYTIRLFYQDQDPDRYDKKIKEGKWPQKYNEIAMPKWIIEKMGKEPKLGEKIELFYLYEDGDLKQEGYGEFEISCILEGDEDDKNASLVADLIVSKEFANKSKYKLTSIAAKCKGRNIEKTAKEVGKNIGVKDDKQIKLNIQYINALGNSKEAIIPFLIVATVVVLSTVLVIYNIFYISIKERVTQLGILAALGATKKQIRNLIFKEGLILALIGIPFGIILGHILSYIIIPIIPLNIKLKVMTSPIIIIVVVVVILITMIISLKRPSRVASKISPVEAIRYTGVEEVSNKKQRKSTKNISVSKLAYFNILRNKKKTIMSIISMTLTGVLFITFYSMFEGIRGKKDFVMYPLELRSNNLNINDADKGTDPLNKDVLNEIKNINGVKDFGIEKHIKCSTKDSNLIKAINNKVEHEEFKIKNELPCSLFGYSEMLFQDLKDNVIEGELDVEKFKNNNLIAIRNLVDKEGKNVLKIGDKLILKSEEKGKEAEVEVTVGAIINRNSRNIGWAYRGPDIVMDESMFTKLFKEDRISEICINVNDEDFNKTKNNVESLIKNNNEIELFNKLEYKKKIDNEFKGMALVAFTLVFIIGLIGVLNTINTMNTNILSRKKELGMLEAVGITSKQLKKLFRIEGLYYSLVSVISSAMLGTIITRVLYSYLKDLYGDSQYKVPLIGILIVGVTFILVQMLITSSCERKLKKDSIVDKIRFNE